jgi:hypothetical protein
MGKKNGVGWNMLELKNQENWRFWPAKMAACPIFS